MAHMDKQLLNWFNDKAQRAAAASRAPPDHSRIAWHAKKWQKKRHAGPKGSSGLRERCNELATIRCRRVAALLWNSAVLDWPGGFLTVTLPRGDIHE
jgi:hypothetical protein